MSDMLKCAKCWVAHLAEDLKPIGSKIYCRDCLKKTDFSDIDFICDLALQFSQVNRTGVYLHDGQPESDTDHTVMLGWVACSFAAKHYPELDQGLIAQFALVHDAPEIYAGDVLSLGMDAATSAKKQQAESQAIDRISGELSVYTWLPAVVKKYEQQILQEARFVRAIDKVLPKIVAWINGYNWHMQNRTWEDLCTQLDAQLLQIQSYAGEFEKLITLYKLTAFRVIRDVHRKQVSNG